MKKLSAPFFCLSFNQFRWIRPICNPKNSVRSINLLGILHSDRCCNLLLLIINSLSDPSQLDFIRL